MRSSKPDGPSWSPVTVVEACVEDAVCDYAQRRGWFCRKMKWVGRRAGPDRVFAKAGRIIWVEFKRPGKKTADPLQKREHKRMRAYGMDIHLIDNIEDGYALFA